MAATSTLDTAKLDELILYISERELASETYGKTKLHKLLWMSDFQHYRLTGESITGASYRHRRHGPMVDGLEQRLASLTDSQRLRIRHRDRFGYVQQRPVPLERADLSRFSGLEIAVVEQILRETQDMSARELSDLSHEHAGWRGTEDGEVIPYESALIELEQPTDEEISIAGFPTT